MELENEVTACPISIFTVDIGISKDRVYLIVSSPNIFCHDIDNPVLYSGIERLWVVIFFIFETIRNSIIIMWVGGGGCSA